MKRLDFDAYERLSAGGGPVPVFRWIAGDLLTPVSAFLSLSEGRERAFLLESVVGGERLARYSFLGRDPIETLEARGSRVFVRRGTELQDTGEGLLAALRRRLGRQAAAVPELPRFTGGAVGYLAYDAVRLFERLPDRHADPDATLASFSLYRSIVAFDHVSQRLGLIALAEPGSRRAFDEACATLDALEADLRRGPRHDAAAAADHRWPDTAFEDAPGYRAAVARAKEHIAAGDIFQVVLSRQQQLEARIEPFAVYRALRTVNPSPYMFFLKDGDSAVAGASPEMLVRVENGRAETRPIAGTRPRGASEEHDARLAEELLADPKERAEHLMLVDLGRNDLGRVCRFGSVAVPELMKVERYSHVTHLVSSVVGELSPGKDALDALVAAFPAGTLSGAPKIRAMEIIDALEPARRGLYGGAVGYLDFRGNMDFCITIRTVVIEGRKVTFQAGAGIVADSDPETERLETEAKAGAMLEALRVAGELA